VIDATTFWYIAGSVCAYLAGFVSCGLFGPEPYRFHKQKENQEVRRILGGISRRFDLANMRSFLSSTGPRDPNVLFGTVVEKQDYVPRHSTQDRAPQAIRALTQSTAEVPTILPQRIPGTSLGLVPEERLRTTEVFTALAGTFYS
jgi:hypothetical protein